MYLAFSSQLHTDHALHTLVRSTQLIIDSIQARGFLLAPQLQQCISSKVKLRSKVNVGFFVQVAGRSEKTRRPLKPTDDKQLVEYIVVSRTVD